MKKILIFGLPRTGTTLIQKYLCKKLKIKSYSEPFNDQQFRASIGDPYVWTGSLSNGIIKVLSFDLDYVKLERLINEGNFDSVIVTQRSNLTDLCVSLYCAEQVTHQFHYNKEPDRKTIQNFNCSIEHVESWLRSYKWYGEAMTHLDNNKVDYTIFDYDKYISGETLMINVVKFCLADENKYGIDSISVPIPYDKLCVNYNEVKQIINRNI